MAEGRASSLAVVRGFAPRDLPAAAAFCERARALDPAVEPFGERLAALAADPRALLPLWRVAEDGTGRLVGMSFAVLRGPGPRADLYAAVLPALRLRGLGRALLEPAIGWAHRATFGPERAPSVLRAAAIDGPGGGPARAFLAALGFAEGPAHLTLRRDGAPPSAPPLGGAAVAPADPASPADRSALRRLADEAWQGDPEAFPGSAAAQPDRLILLARTDAATPAGYLAARRAALALVIEEVAVLPAARRRGIGRALVAAALRGERPRTALLAVAEGNRAALRLYQGLGFRPAGRRAVHELRLFPPAATCAKVRTC